MLLGNGTGGFGAKSDFRTGNNPISVAIGDLRGDGRSDLATANYTANTVSMLPGEGVGGCAQVAEERLVAALRLCRAGIELKRICIFLSQLSECSRRESKV